MKLIHLTFLIIALLSASCITKKESSDTIYYGGDIITMNGDMPDYAEAIVISGGKILFVGSKEEALTTYKSETEKDLEGKTLTPGFIEPHLHPSLAAIMLQNEIIAPYDWNIPSGIKKGVQTPEGYLERVKSSVENNAKKGELYFIWGYHQLWHGDLDRIR